MNKSELVQSLREAHQRVAKTSEQIPDSRLVDPVIDGWSGKDVLAHMAWWHDHSALVIEELGAGRQPYDRTDPANATDTRNERILLEHRDDPPEATRRAFHESFARLMTALEPVTEEDLFSNDRWPWLDGEALVETVLWDSSRHYDAHSDQLESLLSAT
jgi:hypothetical protein